LTGRVRPVSYVSSPVKVRRSVDREKFLRVEESRFRLPGVRASVDPVRSYPFDERYCHALGHLGEVNEQELARDSTLKPLDYVGRDGIEARYESRLRGRDGYEYVEVDASGHEIGTLREKRPVPAVPGQDLHLTLDPDLQQLAWQLTSPWASAAVVCLDPRSGDVLCLMSRPGFDPNLFTGPIPRATWDSLAGDRSRPFFNRTVSAAYPPGSAFKPVVAQAALELGAAEPSTRFEPCRGQYVYGTQPFKCWSVHGSLDLPGAIAHSCNVYFYQLGLRLGLDSLVTFAGRTPLGSPTGIDLPAEAAGNIPTREWLDRRYGRGEWRAGVLLNLAIGQGEILATPLQLAVLYSAIANNGRWFPPRLVGGIDSAGRALRLPPPRARALNWNRRHLNTVRLALERVVEYGTARSARLGEVTIAGKTGTAENPGGADHAWFVGYAPAEQPEIVVAVLVENGGHGGAVAAPIARQLIRRWFDIPEAVTKR
ncbi:penicillin-binding protein 2, partial [candidate division WOR-3 bacterium]|nr:penicillin-binding protein 2 [candidate division WOR-3 bacterium]